MSGADLARPRRFEAALPLAVWLALLLLDLVLRTLVSNNATPARWQALDAGVYTLGALWGLLSWFLLARVLGALPTRARRLLSAVLATTFGVCILLSFAYRLYYYQSPSWQVIKFSIAEPENTRRIISWNLRPAHLGLGAVLIALLNASLLRAANVAAAASRVPVWGAALVLLIYGVNSSLTLITAGFQDPLPVESNSAAALAQYVLATTTSNRHLVAPVRPILPEQSPRPRPNVLLIVHESLRADAVFPQVPYSEISLDARAISPYSARLPERAAEGFFVLPWARANASATEASLPTILSGLELGGDPDTYGRVHTVWSLGKATGAKTWLFSAQTYAWSHFDEYFFDRNLDLQKTGLDLAPAYVNDVGVDDMIPVERALEHIKQLQQSGERWVGVVHFSGSHVPGYPGPGIAPDPDEHRRWRQAASYIDRCVERLVEGVLTGDAAASTIILSTSDHGEPLESSRHIRRLGSHYEEVARIPMWVRVPPPLAAQHPEWGQALAAWQGRNIQNIHILPTIRDALLMDESEELNRYLFAPSLLRSPAGRPDLVVGQSTCTFRSWWQEGIYVVNDRRKLVLTNERSSPELYDLTVDPAERNNLWGDPAARADAMSWAIPVIRAGSERTAACKRIGKNCILP